ncbi:exonuclease subunit SbcD [Erwinia sp. OLTSP20]|uniref:exonuclease subunit SbcD n=1 Tax=unclassified Erwinia TaxID=2622719 RepID=UPI000C1A0F27|nr:MULTISPECIES: exonuclease subunit SbcD [unclassified Erwinia]PIJ52280.1 exonuclease subunit SbcD [Erwinia sp. OAMSP11]PIJ75751.1 exonuclease subunit SbcD [Erwinia sp. OLSSP12]PIJ83689.1 exonuclease subunit SbcD [Erwinia sp. OLMTSP26]PIJ84313.1 exonuclease subunit SbcD [Erwinia sp. OLCASP19]PIJ88751.1 exonuclease subunit SbcD [Erwinia sp. OLMDSP33]
MRMIHTSDWHLGQFFYTKSRAAEHQAFLDWLYQQIIDYQVDVLLVAGDIFDTGSPPSYAREMYNRFVVRLRDSGCQMIVLAGNHDSVAMLNESRGLMACLNTQVITSASDDLQQQVLLLHDRHGEPGALLCAIPFLRPRDILRSEAGLNSQQKQQNLLDAISNHYHRCFRHAQTRRQAEGLRVPIIASGHLTALGVSKSESVRDIYIGTLDAFPAQGFPAADYIALGHIHRPQKINGQSHIRYSGSPIPLSFDEAASEKSVCLVEFSGDTLRTVTLLTVPCFQLLQVIKGTQAEIEHQLAQLSAEAEDRPVWLDIEITSQDYLSDIQQRIQQITTELPVEVLLIRRSREQRNNTLLRQHNETLAELSVEEVFARRLAGEPEQGTESAERLTRLFNQVVAQVRQPESTE